MRRPFALVVALCGACGGSSGDNGSPDASIVVPDADMGQAVCPDNLTSIALTPASSTVTLDGSTPAPIVFTATGTFADSHMSTLPSSMLTWSVTRGDDTPAGTIANGILMPAVAGGTVTVHVADGCTVAHTATTTVTFVLNVTVGAPMTPSQWTGTPVTTGTVPAVVYPSNQTRFPRNIYRTLFQWHIGGATYNQFRLNFSSANGAISIYTNGADPLCAMKNPAAGCWTADAASWAFIAGSNAGGTVTWTVDALDLTGSQPVIRESAPITIGFSKRDVTGAVFYWSTTSSGVRRANITASAPEDYITGTPKTSYTSPTDQVQCVACHVVSRDGMYMAAPVQSMTSNGLWLMQVTNLPPPTRLLTSIPNTMGHGFATISPNDQYLVTAFGGVMKQLDRTGATVTTIALGGTTKGTMPDWSPAGNQVAFTIGQDDGPQAPAALDLVSYTAPSTWGTPQALVPGTALTQQVNAFPQFSPDGQWIAFANGKNGGHGDSTFQLFLVPAAISAPLPTPRDLVAANCVVNNTPAPATAYPPTLNCLGENNMPTWAPQQPGDLAWVAFNSARAYGVVTNSGQYQQIWVAAVDLTSGAVDPSYPAFRLQFQGLNENNHRAYWTQDVRYSVPDAGVGPDAGCKMAGDTCNPEVDCCPAGYGCDDPNGTGTATCVRLIN